MQIIIALQIRRAILGFDMHTCFILLFSLKVYSLHKSKFTSEKYSKHQEETDPDGDGLGDVHLLPVLILKLMEVFSARGPDPGCGHASCRGAHLPSAHYNLGF